MGGGGSPALNKLPPALLTPLLEKGQKPPADPPSFAEFRLAYLEKLREQRDIVQAFYMAEIERNREQLQLLLSQMVALRGASKGISPGDAGTRSESSLVRAATDV